MYLLFDIGGTKMRLAVSRDGKTLGAPIIVSTPEKFFEGMQLFKEITIGLIRANKADKVKAVAGGVAGPLDSKKTKLLRAPNLSGWVGKPLAQELKKMFKAPVHLENDAALAGLGEGVYGAGRGHKIVAYLTVSTGVGGARIVDGRIDASAFGFEPGHQLVGSSGKTLGSYISGNSLQKRFHLPAKEIKDKKVWDETARWLSMGLHNTIVHWSPEVVVLGGSIMHDISLALVKRELKKTLIIFPRLPEIKKAELGDTAGLWGALDFMKHIARSM